MLTEENKIPLDEMINDTAEDQIQEKLSEAPVEETFSQESSELEKLKTELADQKDKFLRLYAEFDNFKRRTSKERIDLIKTAGQDVIAEMLTILDDFDRAQKLAIDSGNPELYPEGLSLIHNKLVSILSHRGLKAMESTGAEFNPEMHEAIAELPASSENQKSKNIDTTEKGYYLGDKIIRFAKVVIGK